MNDDTSTSLGSTQPNSTATCYRCGYDLRGISDEQPCPECGLLASRSRRATDELHDTRPKWLWRISRGVHLILLAILMAAVWPFAANLLNDHWNATAYRAPSPYEPFVSMLVGDLAAIVLWVGVFLLTSPEGYPPADRRDRRLRFLLRIAATAPLAIGVLANVEMAHASDDLVRLIFLLTTVGCAPLPLLVFLQLRNLAKRARSAHLAEHCLIVGIGTSSALVYTYGVSQVVENEEKWGLGADWKTRSDVALGLVLLMSVAAVLFLLWSLYLMALFSVAFHRAARKLRGKWLRDDRAMPQTVGATPQE